MKKRHREGILIEYAIALFLFIILVGLAILAQAFLSQVVFVPPFPCGELFPG
jgi:hypothetical protein